MSIACIINTSYTLQMVNKLKSSATNFGFVCYCFHERSMLYERFMFYVKICGSERLLTAAVRLKKLDTSTRREHEITLCTSIHAKFTDLHGDPQIFTIMNHIN